MRSNDIFNKFCYAKARILDENAMKRFKIFWKKYWADTKVLYRQYREEGQKRRDSGSRGPSVNPASGLPMISGTGVDCTGNSFGTSSNWSNRY